MGQVVVYWKSNCLPLPIPQGYTIMNRSWLGESPYTQINFFFSPFLFGKSLQNDHAQRQLTAPKGYSPFSLLRQSSPGEKMQAQTSCWQKLVMSTWGADGGQGVPPPLLVPPLWQAIVCCASFFHQFSLVRKHLEEKLVALACLSLLSVAMTEYLRADTFWGKSFSDQEVQDWEISFLQDRVNQPLHDYSRKRHQSVKIINL